MKFSDIINIHGQHTHAIQFCFKEFIQPKITKMNSQKWRKFGHVQFIPIQT